MPRPAFKVAQIGAGRMGAIHGRNAAGQPAPGPGLSGRDPVRGRQDPGRASSAAASRRSPRRWPIPTSPGVIVASATDTHLDLALAASPPARRCSAKSRSTSTSPGCAPRPPSSSGAAAPLYVAFNRRFDPHFQALKAKIASGAIGALETPAPDQPRPGAAAAVLHPDQRRPVPRLHHPRLRHGPLAAGRGAGPSCSPGPTAWSIRPSPRPATSTPRALILRCASGRLCVISNTRRSGYGYDQRAEAYGSARRGHGRQSAHLDGRDLDRGRRAGRADLRRLPGPLRRSPTAAELDHFADVLAGEADAAHRLRGQRRRARPGRGRRPLGGRPARRSTLADV